MTLKDFTSTDKNLVYLLLFYYYVNLAIFSFIYVHFSMIFFTENKNHRIGWENDKVTNCKELILHFAI